MEQNTRAPWETPRIQLIEDIIEERLWNDDNIDQAEIAVDGLEQIVINLNRDNEGDQKLAYGLLIHKGKIEAVLNRLATRLTKVKQSNGASFTRNIERAFNVVHRLSNFLDALESMYGMADQTHPPIEWGPEPGMIPELLREQPSYPRFRAAVDRI